MKLIHGVISAGVKQLECETGQSRPLSAIISLHGVILGTENSLILLVGPIIRVVNWRRLVKVGRAKLETQTELETLKEREQKTLSHNLSHGSGLRMKLRVD
jgi:hypothetical protein